MSPPIPEVTEFVNVLPTASFVTCLNWFRGLPVSKRTAALAACNIQLYAFGQFLPEEAPVMLARLANRMEPTHAEVEQAFAEIMPDADGTMKAGPVGKGALLTILQALLPLLISLFAA